MYDEFSTKKNNLDYGVSIPNELIIFKMVEKNAKIIADAWFYSHGSVKQ